MQRITITIDDELAQEIDKLAAARGYQNRSETVRDLVRAGMTQTNPFDLSKRVALPLVAAVTAVVIAAVVFQ